MVLAVYAVPLWHLVRQSLEDGYSSHIVLIPALVAFLLWTRKGLIFAVAEYSFIRCTQVSVVALLMVAGAYAVKSHSEFGFPLLIVLASIFFIVAGFVGFFGTAAFRKAIFPFSLLLMVVPVPSPLIDRVIQLLQAGSADLTTWMFSLLGVPVLREGFVLTVPGCQYRDRQRMQRN